MRILLVGLLLLSTPGIQAQIRAVAPTPASAPANRFYSPGVDGGDYLYVSAQGPRRPDGSLPATFEAQVRQALDNVKSVVQTAGLTMEHVVYTQIYLEDVSRFRELNQVFGEVFTKTMWRRSRPAASRTAFMRSSAKSTWAAGSDGTLPLEGSLPGMAERNSRSWVRMPGEADSFDL